MYRGFESTNDFQFNPLDFDENDKVFNLVTCHFFMHYMPTSVNAIPTPYIS